MRYDGDHKAKTRERVLKEAAARLRADGSDRLGVAAVMARAGLTHGGFYAHFGSKEDLLTEAVGYMFKDRYAAFFADFETVEPKLALRRFADYYLSMGHCDAPDTGCPIPILAGEFGRLPGGAQARFGEAMARLTSAVEGLLTRAGIAEPRALAVSAIAEMVGAVALARTHVDRGKAEELLAAARTSVGRKFELYQSSAGLAALQR